MSKKTLRNVVENERVRFQLSCRLLQLRPETTQTVQLRDGSYDRITTKGIVLTRGDNYLTRFFDPNDAEDAEVIEATRAFIRDKSSFASSQDVMLKELGEYEASEPWPGYDEQTPEQFVNTYRSLTRQAKPALETIMKYELEKPDGETDNGKVKVINDLWASESKRAAVTSGGELDV